MPRMKRVLAAIITMGICSFALGQDRPQAYVGAHLIPIAGDEIDGGVLIVQNGKIVAVGEAASIQIPADAERHDVAGKVIMPGLVDTHSHIGGPSGGEKFGLNW